MTSRFPLMKMTTIAMKRGVKGVEQEPGWETSKLSFVNNTLGLKSLLIIEIIPSTKAERQTQRLGINMRTR